MDTNNTVFLDEEDLGVGTQGVDLVVSEMTSEAIDYVPLVGDVATGVDVCLTVSTLLEGDDVPAVGWFGRLPNVGGERRSGKGGENAESEGGKVVGEHVNNAGNGYRYGRTLRLEGD